MIDLYQLRKELLLSQQVHFHCRRLMSSKVSKVKQLFVSLSGGNNDILRYPEIIGGLVWVEAFCFDRIYIKALDN